MFLILLRTLERFNYTINIHNCKKFVKAFLSELEKREKFEVTQIQKEFEKIDEKIKQLNEKRIEDLDDEFDR